MSNLSEEEEDAFPLLLSRLESRLSRSLVFPLAPIIPGLKNGHMGKLGWPAMNGGRTMLPPPPGLVTESFRSEELLCPDPPLTFEELEATDEERGS